MVSWPPGWMPWVPTPTARPRAQAMGCCDLWWTGVRAGHDSLPPSCLPMQRLAGPYNTAGRLLQCGCKAWCSKAPCKWPPTPTLFAPRHCPRKRFLLVKSNAPHACPFHGPARSLGAHGKRTSRASTLPLPVVHDSTEGCGICMLKMLHSCERACAHTSPMPPCTQSR